MPRVQSPGAPGPRRRRRRRRLRNLASSRLSTSRFVFTSTDAAVKFVMNTSSGVHNRGTNSRIPHPTNGYVERQAIGGGDL
ncbi:hypothetical protein EVAR_49456_1 [Eumeta japonica]|uniref:Uncharacterized protein n=1 Tax=Eumeta variegata TaxID=151549 RepID=A0A4C1Y1U5_EUMVA|nr:hypothetical protein EVAR_49456_1 [Eumeta japonica]